MGDKGERTRERIINAAVAVLDSKSLRDVRVIDVARAAGISPATFYLYFSDVADVLLAAARRTTQSEPDLLDVVSGDWMDGNAIGRARCFVHAYVQNWEKHQTVYRVRNLAAEEGDQRFITVRYDAIRPLLRTLAVAIEAGQRSGLVATSLDPGAMAGTLIAMIERISSVARMRGADIGIRREELLESCAHIIAGVLSGR